MGACPPHFLYRFNQRFSSFSHFWLATVQEVLQADWQDVWHSPQPPWAALFFKVAPFKVRICSIGFPSLFSLVEGIIPHPFGNFNHFRLFFLGLAPKSPANAPPQRHPQPSGSPPSSMATLL